MLSRKRNFRSKNDRMHVLRAQSFPYPIIPMKIKFPFLYEQPYRKSKKIVPSFIQKVI